MCFMQLALEFETYVLIKPMIFDIGYQPSLLIMNIHHPGR